MIAPTSGRLRPYAATPRKIAALPSSGTAHTWIAFTPVPVGAPASIAQPDAVTDPVSTALDAGTSRAMKGRDCGPATMTLRVAIAENTPVTVLRPSAAIKYGPDASGGDVRPNPAVEKRFPNSAPMS